MQARHRGRYSRICVRKEGAQSGDQAMLEALEANVYELAQKLEALLLGFESFGLEDFLETQCIHSFEPVPSSMKQHAWSLRRKVQTWATVDAETRAEAENNQLRAGTRSFRLRVERVVRERPRSSGQRDALFRPVVPWSTYYSTFLSLKCSLSCMQGKKTKSSSSWWKRWRSARSPTLPRCSSRILIAATLPSCITPGVQTGPKRTSMLSRLGSSQTHP